MRPEEFAARLASVPDTEPDKIDLAMLEEAAAIDDGTTVSLEEFSRELAVQKRPALMSGRENAVLSPHVRG